MSEADSSSEYDSPSTRETVVSQLPAIHQLVNLGYQYLTPEELAVQRGGRFSNGFLDGILAERLREQNRITTLKGSYPFTENAIQEAIHALKEVDHSEGLLATNERTYDLLCLGLSVEQTIDGRKSSYDIKFIDWEHPERNVYHVATEYAVERSTSKETRRPDIVLFVNGIPLAVIECKASNPKIGVEQAISQHLRNQGPDEIPAFFAPIQLLLAVNGRDGRYGTVGTPPTHWLEWKENFSHEDSEKILELINRPLAADIEGRLMADPFSPQAARDYRDQCAEGDRIATGQDKLIYALLRPQRLLELVYRYTVFDAGDKKVARYQQYFAVRDIMERILYLDEGGVRKGGVVWHTQGSGKSLTMVMLAKAIALCDAIENPRVVLVTDRVDLDDQIRGTFKACGLDPRQAGTGNDLVRLLEENRVSIITTVINKFEAVCNKRSLRIDDPNIFVLVDEAHRTNYGKLHADMRRVFLRACFVGFTGTPLMQKERSTAHKFGGIIGKPYTIKEAVADGAVVPLRYEARKPEIDINREALDKQFEQQTEGLSIQETAVLKKKAASFENLAKTDQVIYQIARDITNHYVENWKGTYAKGQIVAPRKDIALKYKQALDDIGKVTSAVIISPPDDREGYENAYGGNRGEVLRFWKEMMARYGTERKYNQTLIQKFKKDDEPELIIVVSKLLTGFDAPRNTILYVCSSLKNHTLLQAIARVNRLYKDPVTGDEKDFGYIIDYRGITGDLREALDIYSDDNTAEEVNEALVDIAEEVKKLPFVRSALWDVFKEVPNKKDREALENHLEDEERRDRFYEAFNRFAKVLASSRQSQVYYETVPKEKQDQYMRDLRFFTELRAAVRSRFSAEVDVRPYEQRIQKILNFNTVSSEVTRLTEMIDIFDREAFEREIEKMATEKGKADLIISRTKKTISEKWEEDPVFYERFSRLLDKVLEDYRRKRLSDADRLRKSQEIMEAVRDRTGDEIPPVLKHRDVAKAYFGYAQKHLEPFAKARPGFAEAAAQLALTIEEAINSRRIVSWKSNDNIQNEMRNAIEDAVLEMKSRERIDVPFDTVDLIIEDTLEIARKRLPDEAAG